MFVAVAPPTYSVCWQLRHSEERCEEVSLCGSRKRPQTEDGSTPGGVNLR